MSDGTKAVDAGRSGSPGGSRIETSGGTILMADIFTERRKALCAAVALCEFVWPSVEKLGRDDLQRLMGEELAGE